MVKAVLILMCCYAGTVVGPHIVGPDSNIIEARMTDKDKIVREWIEIREESKDGTFVFRPSDFPVPPARGRRRLLLSEEGRAGALGSGPTDRIEKTGEGEWSLDGQTLHLNINQWEGEYEIIDLQNDIMILQKR